MKPTELVESMPIPEGITMGFENHTITVKGGKGELVRKISTPKIDIKISNNEAVFRAEKPSKREKRMINTYMAHLRNMFKGVMEGHVYKMKVCSGHFPMTVNFKNDQVEVKNFLGEKVPRVIRIKPGVTVKVQGDIINIESINKELAGNAASSIEKLTRRTKFDKRIFQDGIYLIEKDGKLVA